MKHAYDIVIQPWLTAGRNDPSKNFVPRMGFVYSVTPATVVRGGFGKFFGETTMTPAFFTERVGAQAIVAVANDGRPDFASNPYNGPAPRTYAEAISYVQRTNGQIDLGSIVEQNPTTPFSYAISRPARAALPGPGRCSSADRRAPARANPRASCRARRPTGRTR